MDSPFHLAVTERWHPPSQGVKRLLKFIPLVCVLPGRETNQWVLLTKSQSKEKEELMKQEKTRQKDLKSRSLYKSPFILEDLIGHFFLENSHSSLVQRPGKRISACRRGLLCTLKVRKETRSKFITRQGNRSRKKARKIDIILEKKRETK